MQNSPASSLEQLLPPGTVVEGKYRIVRLLGVGGMGGVFEAVHVMLNKRVAIKVLLPALSSDPEMTTRMVREARAASATGHRNIVDVTDMGHTSEQSLFLVMEYLEGKNLAQLIETEGPLALPRAINLVQQALTGLHAVHGKGIVHRDLKPENLMIVPTDEGELVKVLDFGISKVTSDGEQRLNLTQAGLVMGTPQYMSPEQARGQNDIDHRTDIYAMGTILYAALTGRPAIDGDNYNQVMVNILEGRFAPPSHFRPELPAQVDAVVIKAMAVQREQRYADAKAFRTGLLALAGGGAATVAAGAAATPRAAANLPKLEMNLDVDEDSLVTLDGFQESPQRPAAAPVRPTVANVPAPVAPSPTLGQANAPRPGAPLSDALFKPPDSSASALVIDIRPPRSTNEQQSRPSRLDNPAVAARVTGTAHRQLHGSGSGLYQAKKEIKTQTNLVRYAIYAVIAVVGLGIVSSVIRSFLSQEEAQVAEDEATVVISVTTSPDDANILVDGVLQTNPKIRLSQSSSQTYRLEVRATGYQTQQFEVTPSSNQNLNVELERKRRSQFED